MFGIQFGRYIHIVRSRRKDSFERITGQRLARLRGRCREERDPDCEHEAARRSPPSFLGNRLRIAHRLSVEGGACCLWRREHDPSDLPEGVFARLWLAGLADSPREPPATVCS